MEIVVVGLIIVAVILKNKNTDLQKEIEKLKNTEKPQESTNVIKFCPNCGKNLINTENHSDEIEKVSEKSETNLVYETKTEEKIKEKYTEKEIKNSVILSVGAILVVIAALVFLTTTWNFSLGIIKTLIITLMFIVFLGTSYIADKVLNIKQTSKIFLYIAMTYLPLVFLSVSLFELLGADFSIYGQYKYIYLSISTIILSIIYYLMMNSKKDMFFAVGSLILQALSVVLIILNFSNNINIVLIGLSIYNLIYCLLHIKNKIYYDNKLHLVFNSTLTIAIIAAIVFFQTSMNLLDIHNFSYIVLLVINYLSIIGLLKKADKNEILEYVSPAIVLFIALSIAIMVKGSFDIYQFSILGGIAVSYLIDFLLFKKNTIGNLAITIGGLGILYMANLLNKSLLASYFIMIIGTILLIYNMFILKDENTKKIILYMIIGACHITIADFLVTIGANSWILPIVYIAVFLIGNLLIKNKTEEITNVGIPFVIFGYIYLFADSQNNTQLSLIAALMVISYYLVGVIQKRQLCAYVSYGWIFVSLYFAISIFGENSNYLLYVIPISTIIIYGLEYLFSLKKPTGIYLRIILILSFASLIFVDSIIALLVYAVLMVIFAIYNRDTLEKIEWNIIPIISLNLFLINQYEVYKYIIIVYYFLNIVLLIKLYLSKNRGFILLSLTSLLPLFGFYDLNKYLIISFLIISFIVYYLSDTKHKDLFKAIIYVLITVLGEFIIYDMKWSNITILSIGITTIPLILITRNILKVNNQEYKPFEYFGLIIIYLIAIANYSSEADGMFFVGLLLIYTILGYNNKWGPVFITSLAFILINVFLLTRMFWLSIPWWGYILSIGIILIAFAMNNELKEKEKRESILKKVKEKIDL